MGEPVRFGLVGAAYQSQSVAADNQAAINLYPELDESGAGNAPIILLSTPGTKLFAEVLPNPGGATPSLDKTVTAQSGSTVPSYSVGPLNPTATNEWILLAIAYGNVITPAAPFASFGPGVALFSTLNSGSSAVTATGTFSVNSTYAAALVAFYTNGSAPTIANSNSVDVSYGFTAAPRTVTQALPNPTTAGNCILVAITELGTTSGTATVTDTRGNTYGQVADVTGGSGRRTRVFIAQNIAAGATTISVTDTAGFASSWNIDYIEITPLAFPATGTTRGSLTITGRTFYVVGSAFVEVMANGTYTQWGTVANDAKPVSMAASPQQLLLASAGTAYVFDLIANTLTAIPGATFSGPVAQAGICDDFFIVTIKDTKEFVVSAPLDANDWVTNGSAIVSVFPDNIVGSIVSHRQIVFGSDTKTVTYYDSGNVFPFDVVPGSDMDQGLAAEFSYSLIGNTYAWLGADERGHGIVYMASGYTPQRISTHAIEFAIQGYSRIDDAVSFTWQDQGHNFYALYFPTPSVTWVFDLATGMWHQELFNVAATGQFQAARRWNHTFNFGKHLVGDWGSGKVYEMHIPVMVGTAWQFGDDDGTALVRIRRAPHISKSQRRQYYNELQVLIDSGLGPIPPLTDGAGNPRGPILSMRFSNDSGRTWSNWSDRDCGQAGEYRKRLRWLRLGEARDRIFELRYSDTPAIRIVDGYLDYEEGSN